jgi:hypothetical protein
MIKYILNNFFFTIKAIFYPFFLFWQMPIAWAKSLSASKILFQGNCSNYMGFTPKQSINALFYRTQYINIKRYGRFGTSPVLGLGKFDMRTLFHLSTISSKIYSKYGAATTLIGSLIWVFSHLIWLGSPKDWWILIIVFVLFLSTTSYAMAFTKQNYQILGWMFYPLALYLTTGGHIVLATIIWLVISTLSYTGAFFSIPIIILLAFVNSNLSLLLILFLIILITVLRITPFFLSRDFIEIIHSILKLIGFSHYKIKYNREMNNFGIFNWYCVLIYILSIVLIWVSYNKIPLLPILGLIYFIINQRFFRLADEQSLIILVSSLFVFSGLMNEPSLMTIIGIFLALNIPGFFISIQLIDRKKKKISSILNFQPFNHAVVEKQVENFMRPVLKNNRIFISYKDPKNKYKNIFDGYRVIHELPLYVAAKKKLHLFPDWYAVAQTNYKGAPNIWGRKIVEVVKNCKLWNAKYAIIYQQSQTLLDKKWLKNFKLINELDWRTKYNQLILGHYFWEKNPPRWFLLKLK